MENELNQNIKSLNIEDRLLKLSQASQQYLTGEIDYDQYKKLERQYRVDYYSAIYETNKVDKTIQKVIAKLSILLRKIF